MRRQFNPLEEPEKLNVWIKKSIDLFENDGYLDKVLEIYPFSVERPNRLDASLVREIKMHHSSRNTNSLIEILMEQSKFPYKEPIWYLLKKIPALQEKNPQQINRIAGTLYSMTADETIIRLESAPELNRQMGPMFNNWLRDKFSSLPRDQFQSSQEGVHILESTEEEGKVFVETQLNQNILKRPDLIMKINQTYVIGEAKWIGQPGGNQEKQVVEVITFCRNQRGNVRRIGLIDGCPWMVMIGDRLCNDKVAVLTQETEYNIMSSLLIDEFVISLLED